MRNFLSDTLFRRIIQEDEVDSTNEVAMSMLDSREGEEFVVLADSQTSGRGRLGRTWYSPPGKNIYMSMAVRPNINLLHAPILTIMAGVAVFKGVWKCTKLDVNLKWPNDIICKRKKLGGILIETRVGNNIVHAAVVGIGINVNMTTKDLPGSIMHSATSTFIETGVQYERNEIIVLVLREFDLLFRTIFSRNAEAAESYINRREMLKLIETWKKLDVTLGNNVSVTLPNETISGKAIDIDEMCRLKVMTDEGTERMIHAGDVTLLR